MKTAKSIALCRLAAALCIVCIAAAPGHASALVDPSFEDPNRVVPLPSIVNPLTPGFWGVENASSVTGPAFQGIMPHAGLRMLEMWDDGLTWTQAFQFVDISALGWVPGTSLTGSVFVNAGDIDGPLPLAALAIRYYANNNSWNNQLGSDVATLVLDPNPATWQQIMVMSTVPAGATWVGFEVAFRNMELKGTPGYADSARLVPEPGSALLLAFGAAWLLAGRRR